MEFVNWYLMSLLLAMISQELPTIAVLNGMFCFIQSCPQSGGRQAMSHHYFPFRSTNHTLKAHIPYKKVVLPRRVKCGGMEGEIVVAHGCQKRKKANMGTKGKSGSSRPPAFPHSSLQDFVLLTICFSISFFKLKILLIPPKYIDHPI